MSIKDNSRNTILSLTKRMQYTALVGKDKMKIFLTKTMETIFRSNQYLSSGKG